MSDESVKNVDGQALMTTDLELCSELEEWCRRRGADAGPVVDALKAYIVAIVNYDPASSLCCVKGCDQQAIWALPPLCDHHTYLLDSAFRKCAVCGGSYSVINSHDCPEQEHGGLWIECSKPGCDQLTVTEHSKPQYCAVHEAERNDRDPTPDHLMKLGYRSGKAS